MPNMQIQPFIGMQNPQQPLGGLLTAGINPYPQASLDATASPGGGLLASMGPWSQLAYQMAGSPKQGGAYAQVTPPPTPVNTNASGSSGGSALGSIATGLLGSVLKNPSLVKGAVNGISGLLGGSSIPASVAAEGNAAAAGANAASGAYAANGISGISELPSVSSAVDAAPAAGLLASSAPAATGANAIASGTAAASQTGGAAGSIGAGIAAPLAVAGLVGLIGSGAISDKANDAGNNAMNLWSQATGAKWVSSPLATNNGMSLTGNSANGGVGTGHYVLPDGSTLTKAQAAAAIAAWGNANGINTGNITGP